MKHIGLELDPMNWLAFGHCCLLPQPLPSSLGAFQEVPCIMAGENIMSPP